MYKTPLRFYIKRLYFIRFLLLNLHHLPCGIRRQYYAEELNGQSDLGSSQLTQLALTLAPPLSGPPLSSLEVMKLINIIPYFANVK